MLKKIAAVVASVGFVISVGCAKTDAGITTNVKTRLAADDTVKAYQINVDTSNGVVTLAGAVENPAAKEQAVMIARQTDGVRDVVDRITVDATAATSGELDRSTDLDERASNTANNIGNELEQAGHSAANKTEDFGRDAADQARDLGSRAANATSNAASSAGAAVTDGAITSAVKARFLADPTVKGLKIDVDTDNGVVTLSGNVASKAEMDKATMLARNTSGVTRVVSNLHVK